MKMKKKEITGLNIIRYTSITFGGLNPDNVDYIYNKRLQYFYYQNSSQKEITDNDEGLKYDEQGNIINATFNKIYGTGLQIPESTFIENELNRINKIDLTQLKNSQKDLVRFYKQYLEAKQQTSEPEQPETDKPDEVTKELHNHIFKGNAFEVWQSMYDSFQITERSRTDLRFMYEVMKYNNQIQDTITVKNITDWINEFYNFSIDKLHYTAINSNSNSKRMNIYNLIKQGA